KVRKSATWSHTCTRRRCLVRQAQPALRAGRRAGCACRIGHTPRVPVSEQDHYENFYLRAEVQISENADTGLFFRSSKSLVDNLFLQGYEANLARDGKGKVVWSRPRRGRTGSGRACPCRAGRRS